jgi:DNA-binding MarR family transcriptional regulator
MKTALKKVETSTVDAQEYQSRIPYLLGAIANLQTTRGTHFFQQEFGIGLSEARLMYVLGYETVLTARRASEIMGVNKGLTSRALAALESRGLVSLVVDEADTRQRVIRFTKSGQKLYERLMVAAADRERWLLSIYTESEMRTLSALLRRMHAHLSSARNPKGSSVQPSTQATTSGRKRPRVVVHADRSANR